ncbi:Holliday junction branch migration protein RuvA [Rhodobacter sp. KR11]|uniref:Holliday junction branch migration protein RuvA n=1 Tax=Rhodobacter sp. KR11 TaxID=2974588 RepID=UPI002223E8F7|nr:Holliday junction branch migration protein RuvA [Rhodobacter sp. KR11]MCW1918661.1 Holliday junction branch migration protein RuvA [Rhodobacter sp. KR11]
MIGKLSGIVDWKGLDQVLLDVRGVGYIIHVNDRTLAQLPPPGEAVALYTDLLVREDLLQLFGFLTLFEREWHKVLMTVQGVGAKASMAILGALGADGVARAITLGDARAIQAANGVGPKLAQRVILELKSKAAGMMAMGGSLNVAPYVQDPDPQVIEAPKPKPRKAAAPIPNRAAFASDALSALLNLGYGHSEAAEAVTLSSDEAPEADTAALIRMALKRLAPK